MDNQDDYPGSPNRRIGRGGSGQPNMYSPGLRGVDPQYQAAIDFEELRLRRQLEIQQQDIELRSRLMQEQRNQLLSELEYRHQLQQIQQLQALQNQQQNSNSLSQFIAQNPRLLELSQQYNSGQGNSLLSSLQDDYAMQRRQLMLQHQMQQRLQAAEFSNEARQHVQQEYERPSQSPEEILAMMNASKNNRGMNAENPVLRSSDTMAQSIAEQRRLPPSAPPAAPTPLQARESPGITNMKRPSSNQYEPGSPVLQNMIRQKHRGQSESSDTRNAHGDAPQASMITSMKNKMAMGAPQVQSSPRRSPPVTTKEPPEFDSQQHAETAEKEEGEVENQAIKLKESQKMVMPENDVAKKKPAKPTAEKKQKQKEAPAKKSKKVKADKPQPAPKVKGKNRKSTKKSVEHIDSDTKESAKRGGGEAEGTEGSNYTSEALSEHEKNLFRHLMVHDGSTNSLEGKENGKKHSKKNGTNNSSNGGSQSDRKKRTKRKKEKDDNEQDAATLIINFKSSSVAPKEVKQVKQWNQQDLVKSQDDILDEAPDLTPRLKFHLPKLPVEPDLTDEEIARKDFSKPNGSMILTPGMSAMTHSATPRRSIVTGPIDISLPPVRLSAPKPADVENWWPKIADIRAERRMLGEQSDEEDSDADTEAETVQSKVSTPEVRFCKPGLTAMKKRIENSDEPGVIEKLPHCKIYDEYCQRNYPQDKIPDPKFCCQVTENFLDDIMVCCSICSTWRHAQCGGHYKRYSPESVDPSNVLFKPICDRCFLEQKFLNENETAAKRIDTQRIEHLRRVNAANAVMRQAAFAKHSGQYKWPLGSVSTTHISGHTRSVQARHEKAVKQWSEMTIRLKNGSDLKPRERVRARTRELERLLVNIEDAEGVTDRHNMMLFLQNDTSKAHPAGFEVPRRNIFDPEEDMVDAFEEEPDSSLLLNSNSDHKNEGSSPTLSSVEDNKNSTMNLEFGSNSTNEQGCDKDGEVGDKTVGFSKRKSGGREINDTKKTKKLKESPTCARNNCRRKPRFDSMFCSDSCGVSALELDLLRSLQYANEMHPSALRF